MNNSCHNRKSYRIGFAPAEPRRVGVPPAESRRVRRQTSTDAWSPVLLPRRRHRHVVAGIRTGDTCWSGPARRTSIAGRQHTRFLANTMDPWVWIKVELGRNRQNASFISFIMFLARPLHNIKPVKRLIWRLTSEPLVRSVQAFICLSLCIMQWNIAFSCRENTY